MSDSRWPGGSSSSIPTRQKTEIISDEPECGPDSTSVRPGFESGVLIDGRYRLDEEIGRGGMGQVFRGLHLALHIPIAIKVMLPAALSNLESARRFRREARSMSRLRHRNIAQVLDYGDVNGVPYMVIEYLEGQPLNAMLAYGPTLPSLEDVRDIVSQIIDGFEAAHRNGIVHRDLKPENVYLAEEADGRRIVKVLDFGLAKLLDTPETEGTVTEIGLVAGTPRYMSPEQCRSMDVGPSADIYALGCLLTEMLQGEPPFTRGSAAEIMMSHMMADPPPLQRPETAEPVPVALEKLRLDLLAKLPARRPSTMARTRARLLEALPTNTESFGPVSRKRAESAGPRNARAPMWVSSSMTGAVTASQESMPVTVPPGRGVLRVIRWSKSEDGVTTDCRIGLALHGLSVQPLGAEEIIPIDTDLVVLDVEDHWDEACAWLKRNATSVPCPPVACGIRPSRRLPELIALGVGDVLSYPVDSGLLARKVVRLMVEVSPPDPVLLQVVIPDLPDPGIRL